jgi:hypothetical protein
MSEDSLGRIFFSVYESLLIYKKCINLLEKQLPYIAMLCPDYEKKIS